MINYIIDSIEIANSFNGFFVSIGLKLPDNILSTTKFGRVHFQTDNVNHWQQTSYRNIHLAISQSMRLSKSIFSYW